jgi:hypothetical protein
MINQPFAGQAVWFVFIAAYNYNDIDWENFEKQIVFNESPIYLLSSEKEIFETMDLESKEFREKTKNNIKNFQKAKGDNSTSISMLQKIIDTEHIWRRVLDFANQPLIQFTGVDDNGNTFDKQKIGELPKWLKYSKKVTMEIWEEQYYHNKIYDASDVYCFMEVVL